MWLDREGAVILVVFLLDFWRINRCMPFFGGAQVSSFNRRVWLFSVETQAASD